ncbi:hypothetical protein KO317_02450 [Candidatus Micrarchaeota archaeon]|jgi:hypothetical protein|nr:hypothetical protein [Candidatus Micrarchaeota archaeon]
MYKLTLRTTDGNLAFNYYNTLKQHYDNRDHVSFMLETNVCKDTGEMSQHNQYTHMMDGKKLLHCYVNLDEGENYFSMGYDEISDTWSN